MKEIKAIVQPGKLHKIRDALDALPDFPGMSVSKMEGCSPHENRTKRHSTRQELTDFSPKVRIEIVAPDEKANEIVQLIRDLAHTGKAGDGVVWVTPVEAFYRIRD
jgi:nitrogen regulatory protein P-II 1